MKYKVGDRVKIKSLGWYNENKDNEHVHCGNSDFVIGMKRFCGRTVTIEEVLEDKEYYRIFEDNCSWAWTDEMIEGLAEEESEKKLSDESWRYKNIFDRSQYPQSFECPKGYIFKDENGNVINATKIILEKKKKGYPKTYEECCKVLKKSSNIVPEIRMVSPEESLLFSKLIRLKRCRDAYWKIAGEEMGLGKPWEPSKDKMVYSFYRHSNEIETDTFSGESVTFEFPTAEMRDAFYENFKVEIESCKELL